MRAELVAVAIDIAVASSFFGRLNSEHVGFEWYESLEQAKISLFKYVEGFSNI